LIASSNPVDMGWFAVRTRVAEPCGRWFGGVGNSGAGIDCLAREVMVKVYGVAMARPQG